MQSAHDKGAYDAHYAQRRAEAAAGYAALRDEGEAGVAKADRLEKDADRKKEDRKRKKAQVGGLVEKLALLTEEGVALLGRLGCGAEKLGVGDDGPGELIDADSFPKDAAELQKLIDDEAGALVIKKKRQAINAKVFRARKKAKLEKDKERVEALPGRVAELEKEVCLLEFA